MSRFITSVVVLALAGCSKAPTTAPSEADPSRPAVRALPPPTGFARVRSGAKLYTDAKQDHEAFVLELGDAGESPVESRVVRVVGGDGDLLEIENVPSDGSRHCGTGLTALNAFRVRMYVERTDLARVTTREVHVQFEDGTAVTLTPGVAVAQAGRNKVATPGGVRLELPIDDQAVGHLYQPTQIYDDTGHIATLRSTESVRYSGDSKVPKVAGLFAAWTSDRRQVRVYDSQPSGDRARVTLRGRCFELVALADAGAVAAEAPRHAGILGVLGGVPGGVVGGALGGTAESDKITVYYARPGGTVFWRDGAEAGKVLDRQRLGSAGNKHGDKLCFSRRIGRADRGIVLCFDPDELDAAEEHEFQGLGGLIGEELSKPPS